MISVITNIYNKVTKGPTLMELFTVAGKLKKVLITRDVWYVHHGWHGLHRYDIQVLATHAMIRAFRSARSNGLVCRRFLCLLCTKRTLHSNDRFARLIFQYTKRLLTRDRPFYHYIHSSPSGRNVNYEKNNLLGGKCLSCSFYLYRFRKYVSYSFTYNIFVIPECIIKRPVLFNTT
jgi:hypothetical protein